MASRTPLPVQPNLYMTDTAGRPLDGGKVYFGESGKDPELYPIDIFYDEALTIAAPQPVITKNGFLSASGNIIGIYGTADSYSVKVLDANSIQVLYLSSMTNNDNLGVLLEAEIERSTQETQEIKQSLQTGFQEKAVEIAAVDNKLTQAKSELETKDASLQSQINSVGGGKFAYTTYAKMAAAAALPAEDPLKLPANSSIDVTNDTDTSKNGTYAYDGGVFTKSPYDPYSMSKVYADTAVQALDTEIKKRIDADSGLDLEQKVDANGNVYAKYDKDAGLHLTRLEGTVQNNLANLIPTASNTKSIKRRFYSPDVVSYLNFLDMTDVSYIKPPIGLMPSNYRVPDDIIYQFYMDAPTERLSVDTTYRPDDMVVHPNIIECLTPIRGYKYILALNGLTREDEENPFVYGSNDLVNFDLLDGFVQPMDLPVTDGYLSDICWTYDPTTGELVCFWRSTAPLGDDFITEYHMRKTKDLTTWTDIEILFEPTLQSVDGITSPAILYDTKEGIWKMWAILRKSGHIITYRTNRNLDSNWSSPKYLPSGSTNPWHIEVKYVGDKFVMLVNRLLNSHGYFLGISSDGENWKFSGTDLFTTTQTGLYKASFLPLFNSANELYLEVLYTVNELRSGVLHRYMYNATTNAIAIEGV